MNKEIAPKIWLDRIFSKVVKTKKGCWVYKNLGFKLCGLDVGVSKFVYTQLIGEVPEGKNVIHSCRNEKCCNPDHLYIPEEVVDKKKLIPLVNKGLAMYKISKILGCSLHAVIIRVKHLGLKSKYKRKILPFKKFCKDCGKPINSGIPRITHYKYCSNNCKRNAVYKQYIRKWLKKEVSGNMKNNTDISNHVKRWAKERSGFKCEKCGWNKINPITKKCPINVHHKDGNSENTTPKNIEVLCPNCHSLTDTYCSLNRGHGRKYRYKKF